MLNLDLHKNDIIKLYSNGESIYSIAKKYNVYQQRISNLLKRNNIEILNRVYSIDKNYFYEIDTDIKAYILGFITADGCVVNNKGTNVNTLTISLNEKDLIILEMIKKELKAEIPIKKLSRNQVRFQCSQKEIIRDLNKYGITYRKSNDMENLIKNIPDKFKHSYIRGYFDGDGSIFTANIGGKYPHQQKYVSIRGTKEFLEGILEQLSFNCNISYSNGQYMLRFGNKKYVNEFKNYIYKDSEFHLERKYNKFD